MYIYFHVYVYAKKNRLYESQVEFTEKILLNKMM